MQADLFGSHLKNTSLRPVFKETLAKHSKHKETDVKISLRPILNRYFDFREEVMGLGPTGEKVKIDFWCTPKDELLMMGWPPRHFGIEAKGYSDADQRKKTACRLIYQSINYRLSTFPTAGGEMIRPDMVLVHPPLAAIFENSDDEALFKDGYMFALAKTAAMFRVGELVLLPNGFEVFFHGINRWFSTIFGKAKADCLGKEDNHASR